MATHSRTALFSTFPQPGSYASLFQCIIDLDTSEPTDSLTQEGRDFCEKVGSKATKVSEIVRTRDPAVYQAIQDGIDHVNLQAAANVHRIQKWTVLVKDFSIYGGEFGKLTKC